ncbi:MAG: hypothetical protein F6K19_35750 [Cyanothece sp. SIO1E1]|nr:hypothetical protein [Cyanothece sp. SIO1E1]
MLIAQKTFLSKAIGILVGVGVVNLSFTLPAAAQLATGRIDPKDTFNDNEVSDPFSGRNSNPIGNLFNLYHQVNLAGETSIEEFQEGQSNDINSAASEFHRLQQERLQNSSQYEAAPADVAE